MMRWAIIFLVVALVAAVLGFGGIANFSFEIAKFVAVVAIILFVIALVAGDFADAAARPDYKGATDRKSGDEASASSPFSCVETCVRKRTLHHKVYP